MMEAELEQFLTTLPPVTNSEEQDSFETIECEALDSQHRLWLNSYLAYCRASLQREIETSIPDLTMVGFFRRELLKYSELLSRI